MELSVTTNAGEIALRYQEAWRLYAGTIAPALRRATLLVLRKVRTEKIVPGGVITPRTGTLRRATAHWVDVDPDAREGVGHVGVDLNKAIYGRLLELGGVITPKKAKNLTIPLEPALTAAGVARVTARQFIENPGTLGFARAFVRKGGTTILGAKTDGTVEAVFALKKRVEIAPRRYLTDSLAECRPDIVQIFGDGVSEVTRKLTDEDGDGAER